MPDLDFDAAYRGGAPWDIGRPQRALLDVAAAGLLRGDVLDVGCGTGEHALLAATLGLASTGVDASAIAIERARAKAAERALGASFVVGDALALEEPRRFDTVIDAGLFHVFDDASRVRYVGSLGGVLRPGGRLFLLCFSDRVPPIATGPRRVSEAELRDAFADGWAIEAIEPAEFEVVSLPFDRFAAWLARIARR